MKNLNLNLIKTLLAVFTISTLSIFGCSENNSILSPSKNDAEYLTDNFGENGRITVEVRREYQGFSFKVTNRTQDTIVNDFHVQFDSTAVITDWSLAWQFDPATTDLNKGKIGQRCNNNQQCLAPGQSRDLLWVRVKFDGKKKKDTYNWQATRNGEVVQRGSGTLIPD
ncbi:MAG: hypothetical protein ACRDFC_04755 [Ignavibacteria bacterium]